MATQNYNIIKNLFYSGISTFTTFFLFILLSFLGRILGSEDYGVFTTALSIATIFEMFTDFGLRDISVRNVSRNKSLTETYAGNLFSWKLFVCVLIYIVMIAVVNILGYDPRTKTIIYILTASAFLKSMKYTFRIFFQAHDNFGWDTILVIIERTSLLAFGLAVLFKWKALLPFAICFTSVRAVDFLVTLIVLRAKITPIKIRFDFQFMKNLQIEALPLGLFFIILTVFAYIDTVMLSLLKTYHDVGIYNAAFKIYEGITILPTIFWLVFLPRLSDLFHNDKEYHKRLSVKAVKYMFIAAMPTLLYGIIYSEWLIDFFFKSEFTAAILTLKILFFGIAFQYPNWMLNATLISMNKQKVIMIFGSVGLAIKVIANLFLIPVYGYNGSAVATVLSEFVIFTGLTIYLHRYHINIPIVQYIIKPAAVTGILYLIFHLSPNISVLLLTGVTAILYLIAVVLLRIFDRDEIDTFISNFKLIFKPVST